ncbi:hypothetical protein [Thermoflavimicrobium dichotomicum]|uniref:Uncharacterized protein n=1 Tax=Thermoflavimicrobium dichotomicum TaxID=46223 RepID=A0A1I3RT28_9BACL|nr:hypothetical protein [Thermoflavimicrobium dichotomicum]SFJ49764.1 hypothetical protein SAMN05421852_11126 [Thermoflavimicrobium dichotomicum]
MGTEACILKEHEKYTPEKLLADAIVAAFHADVKLHFTNIKFFEDGRFRRTILNIMDDPNDHQIIFNVMAKDRPEMFFYDYEYVGLDSNRKLYCVGYIEDVYGVDEILFRFIYEYLKINPHDYFWVSDFEWVYRWEDMQKFKSLPYDPYWYQTNPKLWK